jgi:predicted small metal-binding protein
MLFREMGKSQELKKAILEHVKKEYELEQIGEKK